MGFYLAKTINNISIEEAEDVVVGKLKEHGFGIVTEINMTKTLKNKLDVDFRPYKILGACNPKFAYEAISKEDKIGVLLPCNVCLQQSGDNNIEVFAVNPLDAMKTVGSKQVEVLAEEIYKRLNAVIESL